MSSFGVPKEAGSAAATTTSAPPPTATTAFGAGGGAFASPSTGMSAFGSFPKSTATPPPASSSAFGSASKLPTAGAFGGNSAATTPSKGSSSSAQFGSSTAPAFGVTSSPFDASSSLAKVSSSSAAFAATTPPPAATPSNPFGGMSTSSSHSAFGSGGVFAASSAAAPLASDGAPKPQSLMTSAMLSKMSAIPAQSSLLAAKESTSAVVASVFQSQPTITTTQPLPSLALGGTASSKPLQPFGNKGNTDQGSSVASLTAAAKSSSSATGVGAKIPSKTTPSKPLPSYLAPTKSALGARDGAPAASTSGGKPPPLTDDDLLAQAIRNRNVLRQLTVAHRWSRACGELVGWSARLESELETLNHVETLLTTVESSLDDAEARLEEMSVKEKSRFNSLSSAHGKGFSLEQNRFWDKHRDAFFKALKAHQTDLHRLNAALVAKESSSPVVDSPVV